MSANRKNSMNPTPDPALAGWRGDDALRLHTLICNPGTWLNTGNDDGTNMDNSYANDNNSSIDNDDDEMVYETSNAVNHDCMLLIRFSMYFIALPLTSKNRREGVFKLE